MAKTSIKQNFIMNAIYMGLNFLFPLITFPYISRVLGPSGTGKVNFAVSTIAYFTMIAQLGIPTYGIKKCAQVREDREKLSRTVHEIFFINLMTATLTYAVFLVLLFSVEELKSEKTLFLIVSTQIFLNVIGMEWLYQGLEEYRYITIRSFIFKLISLVAVFLMIRDKGDYIGYGIVTVVSNSAAFLLNFVRVRKHIIIRYLKEYDVLQHIKPILVFFAMSCAVSIYTNLDNVMIGFLRGNEEVGIYTAAVKIKQMLVAIVTSLGTVLLPRSAYYLENNKKEEFYRISQKAIRFVMVVAMPICAYFIIFAREGIQLLAGAEYASAVIPMQIIMPTVLFIGLTNIMGIQMLVPLGEERKVLYSVVAGAFVDFVINIMLIPSLGATGAAIGTVTAEFIVWIVQFLYLRNIVKDYYYGISYWKIIVASGMATMVASTVKLAALNSFLALVISAILFVIIYGAILTVSKEPLVIDAISGVKGFIRKKNLGNKI